MIKYNFGLFEGNQINDKIKSYIDTFIEEKYKQNKFALREIVFREDKDSCFGSNVGAVYDNEKKEILLKYSEFKALVSGELADFQKRNVLHTLAHELQHSENSITLRGVFKKIENTPQLGYVKVGIQKILDEYWAEYNSCLKVLGGTAGMLNGIIQICFDIKDKRTEPLDFYLMLLNIIPQALGEAKAIQEITGENRLLVVYERISDENFKNIVSEFENILSDFAFDKEQNYITECEKALIKLLIYLQVDFDFLKQVDEE